MLIVLVLAFAIAFIWWRVWTFKPDSPRGWGTEHYIMANEQIHRDITTCATTPCQSEHCLHGRYPGSGWYIKHPYNELFMRYTEGEAPTPDYWPDQLIEKHSEWATHHLGIAPCYCWKCKKVARRGRCSQ